MDIGLYKPEFRIQKDEGDIIIVLALFLRKVVIRNFNFVLDYDDRNDIICTKIRRSDITVTIFCYIPNLSSL